MGVMDQVSVNDIYLGSLGHVNDLRSVASNIECQASIIKKIHSKKWTNKSELYHSLYGTVRSTMLCHCNELKFTSNFSTNSATCLGVTWSSSLSPKESNAFFSLQALGISRGKQNSLTASEAFEVCVLPICLYGAENRLLTDPLVDLLEKF